MKRLSPEEEVESLRARINQLNEEFVEKLAERVRLASKIGAVKRKQGHPIVDQKREEEIYKNVRRQAIAHGLDAEGVEKIFKEIIRLCTEAQLEEVS